MVALVARLRFLDGDELVAVEHLAWWIEWFGLLWKSPRGLPRVVAG